MMRVTVEGVYEQDILRLAEPIALKEGTRVHVTVSIPQQESQTVFPSGRFSWERSPLLSDRYIGSVADELIRQRREE